MTPVEIEELANFLDVLASDQIGFIRLQRTKRDRRDCEIRSATYKDAARLIREKANIPARP